jgi:dipeptidyl aminopeptidase/acylaminoacyl peptidase
MLIRKKRSATCLVWFLFTLTVPLSGIAQKKALTFTDIMQFKAIVNPVISDDGNVIAYAATPDRGDGEVKVHRIQKNAVFTIERGERPTISSDARWVVTPVAPRVVDLEKAKNDKDKPKKGLAVLDVQSGEIVHYDRVDTYSLSEDGKWLAIQYFKEEKEAKKRAGEKSDGDAVSDEDAKKGKILAGSDAVLIHLETHQETKLDFVHTFAFDSTSAYFVYSAADSSGSRNGLFCLSLKREKYPQKIIDLTQKGIYSHLTWNNRKGVLAFLSAVPNRKGESDSASLWIWDPVRERFSGAVLEDGLIGKWTVPVKNELVWTRDGARLFFGMKPVSESENGEAESEDDSTEETIDLLDMDQILKKREVDVWHWNDPFIIPHQKKRWKDAKDRTYRALYHLDSGQIVPLADRNMADVQISQNPYYTLGASDMPYRKYVTWEGLFSDYYLVNLLDGSRKKIVSRLEGSGRLSPRGRFVVYYQDCHWFLFNCETGETRNLTQNLDFPFYNEDHDYPEPAPGYGVAGWIENDRAVLIYDKYDIWQFPTDSGDPFRITGGEGRKNKRIFRIQRVDPEQIGYKDGEEVLLSAYHDITKKYAFYSGRIGKQVLIRLLEEPKRFRFLAKAKKTDRIIYTRESYAEFPDIWFSDLTFRSPKKVTHVNPQIRDYAWGTAELVEWNSLDGIPLQGVLIKPGDYKPGQRYPVLVYYYRFFSQRLYEFNDMAVNHRPNFPFYASNGYAVFLPDIRFEIGRPGFSATKCLVPGVQKLIDIGIADPGGIALHGHSWSGYQTAFVITQTDLFACAMAGAPVSNMTSAYSGIRYESGLARQFQYEQSQSRIGGSLWDVPERYIENSPVFFADKIHTPLLIMFGDEDGAVPWTQGIELYLAMRRLEKDCVFLQYRGEPHHPRKYANRLDYSIRMKEYLDHYCKHLPAAEWIEKGVLYNGK